MKRTIPFFLISVCLLLLSSGCGREAIQQSPLYSNLTEKSVRLDLDSLLHTAGIPEQNCAVLFEHVDQINSIMKPEEKTEGMNPLGPALYDPFVLQDAWNVAYPDFFGYNCRITAFSLLEDTLITVPESAEVLDDSLLLFDLNSLETDPSADINSHSFRAFYSAVPTQMTKDVKVHAENWKKSWKERGISIEDRDDIRLISVVFHAEGEENSYLFVGHTGVLLPTPDGNLWFLEKLAFQEPYQVVVLEDRKQLRDYLMGKYDVDQGQPVAKPFILENMELMKEN